MAGGSEAQNEEAQALAAQTIGCKPFNRTALHMQACTSSLFMLGTFSMGLSMPTYTAWDADTRPSGCIRSRDGILSGKQHHDYPGHP